jgi:lipoprotein-anchoring transpeptidase ErfK/SrfK
MQLKRISFLALFSLSLMLPGRQAAVQAQETTPSAADPDSGSVVCPPGVYPVAPEGCLPLGPSEYLTQLAVSGITLPIQALPIYPPSSDLNTIDYSYFKVNPKGVPLYNSLSDAQAGISSGRSIAAGAELLVSYIQRVDTQQGVFYQLQSGYWIPGDGGRMAVPVFQGQLFSSTPKNAFGWVLGTIPSYTAPGIENSRTGRTYYHYQIVQIFATQTADQEIWDLIGPDEWIEGRQVASVTPRTTPPPGVDTNRWIEVNLAEQTLAVYDNNQLVFATAVATGVDRFWTRPGLFKIYEKKLAETMSGSSLPDHSDYYYIEDVPWTMYFDESRALHGAYWHNKFGYQMSHGCVNMSVGDAHWLYNWAHVGDYVYVYDPSGRTPTDPALFGSGAP